MIRLFKMRNFVQCVVISKNLYKIFKCQFNYPQIIRVIPVSKYGTSSTTSYFWFSCVHHWSWTSLHITDTYAGSWWWWWIAHNWSGVGRVGRHWGYYRAGVTSDS